MGRVLGIDLGTKRIGVANSDASGTLASPHSVIERRQDRRADHRMLAELVSEYDAEAVVVGLPLSLDGREGAAAQAARAEANALAAVVAPVPVELYDERFTTVTAHQALQQQGLRAPARRRTVDKAAAAVMLQHWLDARVGRERSQGTSAGEAH